MMRSLFCLQLVAAGLLFQAGLATAHAQTDPRDVRFLAQEIPNDVAVRLLDFVQANIQRARGESGQPLRPLSPDERTRPLLEIALVKEIADVGYASGVGETCGLDWQSENFLRLMRRERERGDRTSHQLAAVAMLHGLFQEQAVKSVACGPETKPNVAAFYAAKWGPPIAR